MAPKTTAYTIALCYRTEWTEHITVEVPEGADFDLTVERAIVDHEADMDEAPIPSAPVSWEAVASANPRAVVPSALQCVAAGLVRGKAEVDLDVPDDGTGYGGHYKLFANLYLRRVGVLGAYWPVPECERPADKPWAVEGWDHTHYVLATGVAR